MLVFLLENPTDDSVELAIEFLKECGQKLSQVSPHGLDSVFSTLNNLLYQSLLDKRTKYMIEILFNLRKDQFKSNPAIQPCLHLVDENYQYTHMITLDNPCQPDPMLGKPNISMKYFTLFFYLGVFLFDDQYDKNEEEYYEMRKTILDEECRVKRSK
jgi:pre-mRNA-splicing factor CWC22